MSEVEWVADELRVSRWSRFVNWLRNTFRLNPIEVMLPIEIYPPLEDEDGSVHPEP